MLPPSDITTAAELTDETSQESSHTAIQPTTATATANAAAVDTNNASNAMRVDTATATSTTNDNSIHSPLFVYSHEEVQRILEDARLEGWQAGLEEGHCRGAARYGQYVLVDYGSCRYITGNVYL
jgi:hypothetical protein